MNARRTTTLVAALVFLPGLLAASAQEKSRYMGGEVTFKTAPNGALVNAEVLEINSKILYLEPTTEKVADGVWCIGGHSLANTTVIEGNDGLIVYDTGDNIEEAEHIREAIGKISDKPIKVIIYSHSHYALGGGALVDNPEDVMVIGHPTLNDTVEANLQGGGAPGGAYGEIGPVLTARTVVQMNNFLPEEGPDARLSGVIPVGIPISFLPATVTPEHGETMDVLGIEMQFLTEFTSDDHNLTVWIPEKGIVLNNFYWPGTPNLYTLRGGTYRDPMIWRDGLAYAFASFYVLTIPITGTFFSKRTWLMGKRYGFITPGDMYAYYYNNETLRWLVVATAVLYSIFYSAVQLMAAGALFNVIAGVPTAYGAIFLAFIVWFYVVTGGLKASTWVGVIQFILLVSGIIILGAYVLREFGGRPRPVAMGSRRSIMTAPEERSARPRALLGDRQGAARPQELPASAAQLSDSSCSSCTFSIFDDRSLYSPFWMTLSLRAVSAL